MDVDINGITVIFPFKPYDIQINYMRSVITSLQKKQNALLESPTGTGKTLSLLCASIAWLEERKFQGLELTKMISPNEMEEKQGESQKQKGGKGWKGEAPIRIVYSSRTHSQLNQACNELKNSYYKFCSSITIGSRDQLCINPEVKSLETNSAKNQTCRYKVKNNQCKFHHNYERKVSELGFDGSKVYDIEDLIKFGNEHKACPYYMAKAKSDFNTSLIFMPYNYVLDPSIRRTLKLNLENTVIIFDEGHNIERVCEDSMSTELKSEWLALFINTYDSTLKTLKLLDDGHYDGFNEKELSELNIHDVARVKMLICDLEMELDRLVRKNQTSKTYHQTEEIFQIFERIGLDFEKCNLVCGVCEKIITYVMNSTTSFMTNSVIAALTSICSFLEIVIPFSQSKDFEFSKHKTEFIRNYKLYSEMENANSGGKGSWMKKKSTNMWTLYLWCMSPSVAIKSLINLGVHNLIITSGTLSPLESFECEMGISFPVKLQNSHVITKNQLSIQVIYKDPSGHELTGSYEKRNDFNYYKGLGFTILELCRVVPKGVFIFFSSYSLINKCIEMWKEREGVNIWNSISSKKKIFVEPRNKTEFSECMQSFKDTVDQSTDGAIFMGVSRGKLSEGIDLGDNYCRAVIIVGLPYPARYDPKVILKQKYLDENNCKINGIKWYMLQMKRALNQSIGRVVRHKSDYGAIVICDSRFRQLHDGLSRWIQAFLTNQTMANADFRSKLSDIQHFFRQVTNVPVDRAVAPPIVATVKPKVPTTEVPSRSQNDDLMESMFDSMKHSYQACGESRKSLLESDSIFDSFPTKEYTQLKNNKRNLSYNSRNETTTASASANKKSRIFLKEVSYFKAEPNGETEEPKESSEQNSRNDKIKQMSKYFSRDEAKPAVVATGTVKIETIDLLSDLEDEEVVKPKSEAIDYECEELKCLTESILLTESDRQSFEMVVKEINVATPKYRQLLETLRVYSRKKSATYLALRMNFIMDSVEIEKRNSILKDFANLVPVKERRHFLTTCKVKS